jgi:hypothetical protein
MNATIAMSMTSTTILQFTVYPSGAPGSPAAAVSGVGGYAEDEMQASTMRATRTVGLTS